MLIVTTAATTEPVTVAEAKAHLRVTHNSDDALIGALITAAREAVEQNTGRALAEAAYRHASDEEIGVLNRLPLWPVDSVSEVSYADAEGARVVIDPADYVVDGDRATVALVPPADGDRLSVDFAVDPAHVPVSLKYAILLVVGDLYANPEATITGETVADNPAVDRLLYPHRVNLGL
jgi:uncharacterized phiE125 gp8 family phage protein